jgi:hypothetical protein
MFDKAEECSAYQDTSRICANGFIQSIHCQKAVTCSQCGNPSNSVPACLNEALHPAHLTEDGGPRYYPASIKPNNI